MSKTVYISSWTPNEKQELIFNSDKRYIAVRAGRRSGKSFAALHCLLKKALEQPNRDCLYVAPTNRQAEEIGFTPLSAIIPEELISSVVREKGNLQIKLINGSRIVFRSSEQKDALLRGLAIDYIVLDEIDFYNDAKYLWQSVIRPALIDRKAPVLAISSPASEGTLISEWFEEWGAREDGLAVHMTAIENPAISEEEIEQAKRDMDEITFRREILGEPVGYSGLLLSRFINSVNTYNPDEFQFDPNFKHLAGLDYGVTDPTAITYALLDYDGVLWVYDYWEKPEQLVGEICDNIKEHREMIGKNLVVWYDAANRVIGEEINARGVASAEKSAKDVRVSIQVTNEWFSLGKIKISSKLDRLLKCVSKSRWDTNRIGEPIDRIKHDEYSHGVMSLVYLVYSLSMNEKAYRPKKYTEIDRLIDRVRNKGVTQRVGYQVVKRR